MRSHGAHDIYIAPKPNKRKNDVTKMLLGRTTSQFQQQAN